MRRTIRLSVFLLVIGLALLSQGFAAFADKRVALIVGNSKYEHTPHLDNPVNDANDVAQALTAIGFQVTLKLDPSKREMDQSIAQFARDATGADAAIGPVRPRNVSAWPLPCCCENPSIRWSPVS